MSNKQEVQMQEVAMSVVAAMGLSFDQLYKKVGPLGVSGQLDSLTIHQTGCQRAGIQWVNKDGEVKSMTIDVLEIPGARRATDEEIRLILGNLEFGKTYTDSTLQTIKGPLKTVHISKMGVHVSLAYQKTDGEVISEYVFINNIRGFKAEAKAPAEIKKPGGWGDNRSSSKL